MSKMIHQRILQPNNIKISQHYNKNYNTIPYNHIMMLQYEKNKDDEQQKINKNHNFNPTNTLQTINKRYYHTTLHNDKGASLIMGLGAVALTAKAGQYTIQAYEEWQKNRPTIVEEESKQEEDAQNADTTNKESDDSSSKKEGKKENIFEKWFNLSVGSKYYEGGFEDKMTRREAALILGVRESSSVKRIKESHRKILMLNHPDTGGSTYIATKLNEAKELLLKGKE